jgi:predicted nicotinamide N-methyase
MPATTATRSITIQIPDGADPGDTLEFQVGGGQSLEWVVPEGSTPGDVFEIHVAMEKDDDEDDEKDDSDSDSTAANKDTVSIEIESTICPTTLDFALRLPADERTAQMKDDNNNHQHGDDVGDSDGTFALPWHSGILLANNWNEIIQILVEKHNVHSKARILELGAGLGVVGLSLAAAACLEEQSAHDDGRNPMMLVEGAELVLTDLPAAIPLLEFNVNFNRPFVSSRVKISTRALRWSLDSPELATELPVERPYDCLLGSDLLYNIEQIPSLVATMKRLLHPIRGVVILAVRWRKPELERQFFQTSGLEWELLPLPNTCPLSWKDFGNPSCDQSNRYFHQTQVAALNGTPTSIAYITEEQAKDLPKQEFQAWERSFIQFYLGRPKGA